MRVAVVGLGVAGSAAAALLARAGHDVTVFEREPELRPAGAGVLLQPSGRDVLESLGALEEVRSGAARIEELLALSPSGRTISRLRYSDLEPGAHALGVHRRDLMSTLTRLAEAAGARIELGQAVDGVADARVRGFDLVVGADGARSALCETSGLVRLRHEYRWGALWSIGTGGPVRARLHQVSDGTTRLAGVLPLGGDRFNLFWSVRRDRVEALRRRGFDAWREEFADLCPEAREALESLGDWADVRFASYRHTVLRRPHGGALVLVGDAAHAMSPHLGQGVNLGLVDALALGRAVAEGGPVEKIGERYAASRRRQIAYYSAVTFALTPFFQSGGTLKGLARDTVLPYLPLLPSVRQAMLRTLAGRALSRS